MFAEGGATAVILLEQSAAFDTIDHDTFLDSLGCWFVFNRVVLDWFKSYLSNHSQCITTGSILSKLNGKKLLYGVPQGSVLGPIFFSLYPTPLSKVIQNHSCINFHFCADDILHVKMFLWPLMSHCLDDVKRWLSTNKLNSLCLAQSLSVKNLITPSQSIYLVILYHQSMQLGTLVSVLTPIFSLSCHVMKVYKACFAHVRDLK